MKNSFKIILDPFCFRQFDRNLGSTFICEDKIQFNETFQQIKDNYELKPGYAPFCKHLFMPNFTQATQSVLEITEENRHLLVTDFISRAEYEVPVLMRWFPKEKVTAPLAKYLDIILYSKEQITLERASTGQQEIEEDFDYGVIYIKPQNVDYEQPMEPITAMRNALGKEEGGSGVPLNKEYYSKCVEFWKKHASIK